MRITDATESMEYVKVEADIGPRQRDKVIYYIRKEIWVNMTGDEIQSELQMMQHSDVAYDPVTNTILKNRFPDFDTMIAVMASSAMYKLAKA